MHWLVCTEQEAAEYLVEYLGDLAVEFATEFVSKRQALRAPSDLAFTRGDAADAPNHMERTGANGSGARRSRKNKKQGKSQSFSYAEPA